MSDNKDQKNKKEKRKHPFVNYSAALKMIAEEDVLGTRMPKVKKWLGEFSDEERKIMLENLSEVAPEDIASMFRVITNETTPKRRRNVVDGFGLLIKFSKKEGA